MFHYTASVIVGCISALAMVVNLDGATGPVFATLAVYSFSSAYYGVKGRSD